MMSCIVCRREFISIYALNCHSKTHRPDYNPRAGYDVGALKSNQERFEERKKQYALNPKLCKECKQALPFLRGSNPKQFCSNSCAASYSNARRTIKQTKIRHKDVIRVPRVEHIKIQKVCEICGQSFTVHQSRAHQMSCSKKCSLVFRSTNIEHKQKQSMAGRKSAQAQRETRRSKNEHLFASMCSAHWTDVRTNEPLFNGWDADVIIPSLKIAVLWNGKWHYEKITEKHSVLQVQNRDKIKIKEIQRAGYIAYTIKDMGKFNPEFVKEQFNVFLLFVNNMEAEVGFEPTIPVME